MKKKNPIGFKIKFAKQKKKKKNFQFQNANKSS